MAKLPILKSKKIIKALKRAGFFIHVQVGSHAQLRHHSNHKLRVTVPIHNNDIKIRTFKSILAQTHLSIEEFKKFL